MTQRTNPNAISASEIAEGMETDPPDVTAIRRIVIAAQHEYRPTGLAITVGQPLAR